ncbi:hypothetical protein AWA2013_32330 (plasmid) [Lactiplantibacillus plantarum]|jgi:hypothetical protein|nr:hypothetical protein AWA2013_32330 [Lactiplantibacillus plantarum]
MLGNKSLFKLIPGILIVRADKQLNMKGAFKMTKPSKAVEKIEHLLADPWAVDIQKFGSKRCIILINVNSLTLYTLTS